MFNFCRSLCLVFVDLCHDDFFGGFFLLVNIVFDIQVLGQGPLHKLPKEDLTAAIPIQAGKLLRHVAQRSDPLQK